MNKRRLLYPLLITAFVAGVVLLIVGGILYWHHGSSSEPPYEPYQRNVLRNSSDSSSYKEWLTSSDVYQSFYFFDVQAGLSVGRPKTVKEVGPYVYRVYQDKTDVKYGANETTVDYTLGRRMEFVPHLSRGRENDSVTVPNIPALALASWSQSLSFWSWKRLMMFLLLVGEKVFVPVSVSDLLWGQRVTLWDRVRDHYRHIVPNDTWFGLMYRSENRSTVDNYKVWTGADDATDLRKVLQWDNRSSLLLWESAESNQLNGTDGSAMEPSNHTVADSQYIFDPLWCRSMEFINRGNLSLSDMTVNDYIQSLDAYNNSLYGRGFCTGGRCMRPGVMNATVCQANKVSLMWSEPHFYNADPHYGNAVRGLKPNKTLHESSVVVEPLTGTVVSSSRKLQMNIHVQRLYFWPAEIPDDTVFPVMWMKEEYEMSEDDRRRLHDYISKGCGGGVCGLVMMAVGGALVLLSLVIGLVACLIGRRSQPVGGDDDPLIVA